MKLPRVLFACCGIAAAYFSPTAVSGAAVNPDAASLLKGKRVLVALPTYATDFHPSPRTIVNGKLERIKAAHGIATLTFLMGVDTMTLATLNRYDIVFFNYFTRVHALENTAFGRAFREWLKAGNRGWVGNHNTGSQSEGEWNWWRDSVQSMRYIDHKDQNQRGTIKVTTDAAMKGHRILAGLDPVFTSFDEWYSFDLPPKAAAPPTWADCKPLYYLDESTVASLQDKMGSNHPVAWIREDARGNRYFTTNLIHSDEGANSDFYHSLLMRGLEYTAGYAADPSAIGLARPGLPGASQGAAALLEASGFRLLPGRILDLSVSGCWRLSIRSVDGRLMESLAGRGPEIPVRRGTEIILP